jgi:hypothetical protein
MRYRRPIEKGRVEYLAVLRENSEDGREGFGLYVYLCRMYKILLVYYLQFNLTCNFNHGMPDFFHPG